MKRIKPVLIFDDVSPKQIEGYDKYKLFDNDMWFDGESWSSNDRTWVRQKVFISKEAKDEDVIKALKKAKILIPYQRWTLSGEFDSYIYIVNNIGNILWELEKVIII